MVFPAFFYLNLNLAIRSSWSEPADLNQLPVLFLLTVQSFSIFGWKEYNQSDFRIDHLEMSMCITFSCVLGRGCLLWPVRSLSHFFSFIFISWRNIQCVLLSHFFHLFLLVGGTFSVFYFLIFFSFIFISWTSAFSWQNSVSLWPASYCTPRPNLPVTPGISWLATFAFQSSVMKRTSFLALVLEGLVGLHRTIQLQFLQLYGPGHKLALLWYWEFALEMNRDHSVVFEIASKYWGPTSIQTTFNIIDECLLLISSPSPSEKQKPGF